MKMCQLVWGFEPYVSQRIVGISKDVSNPSRYHVIEDFLMGFRLLFWPLYDFVERGDRDVPLYSIH